MTRLLFIFLFTLMQMSMGAQFFPQQLYLPWNFDIYPIGDFEVEMQGINGGTKNVVPYDFYAAFGCAVNHPIDTVFYADGFDFRMAVESHHPCYVIVYGLMSNGQEGAKTVFYVNNRVANNLYRDTLEFSDNSYSYLRRIIVVNASYVLKKAIENGNVIGPLCNANDGGGSEKTSQPDRLISNLCSIDILDLDFNETSHIEGNLTGNNVYLLQGSVIGAVNYSYQNAQLPHVPYTIFTKNSTTDVELFVMNSNNQIIAHNNDYSAVSDYDWDTESRVDMTGNDSLKAIILLPYRDYLGQEDDYLWEGGNYVFQDDNTSGVTDLYLGCKYYDFTYDDGDLFFPNLRTNDAIESDYYRTLGQGIDYNCFAWALGYYSYYFHHNFGGVSTVNGLISYYEDEGYTTDGATEANSEIDIWEKNDSCTHASVRSYTNSRSYGYDWESKDGFYGGRFMHPRYSIANDDPDFLSGYGHVAAHMIKDPNYVNREVVYENISFSDKELEKISLLQKKQSLDMRKDFADSFNLMLRELKHSHISNPTLFKNLVGSYQEVLKKCKTTSEAQVCVMQKLSEGDILAAYILLDIKNTDSLASSRMMTVPTPKVEIDENTQRLVRPDLSEATLYAKALLNEMTEVDMQKDMNESISFSNKEDAVSIRMKERRAIISFSLDKESYVSLLVSRYDGTSSRILLDQKSMQDNEHHVSVILPEKGLYAVTLIVNGHVYIKKFSVK